MLVLLDSVGCLVRVMNECITILRTCDASKSEILDKIGGCTDVIEENLPRIDNAILTSRHAALHLLQWAQRSGRIDDSALPGKYRES